MKIDHERDASPLGVAENNSEGSYYTNARFVHENIQTFEENEDALKH